MRFLLHKKNDSRKSAKSGRFWLSFLFVSLSYAWYSFYAPSNDILWDDNYTEAQQQAPESGKPIILFFTGKWCSPCQIMKHQVWADNQVISAVNAGVIPVMIDVDDKSMTQTLAQYNVSVTPKTIVTDSKGIVLQEKEEGISKTEFLQMLEKAFNPTIEIS